MSDAQVDRMAAYRQAGVDLDLNNAAAEIASHWAQTTWQNREGLFGTPTFSDRSFSSAKRLVTEEIRQRPGVDMVFGVDGTGTKPENYELMRRFRGLGADLMAMAIDDLPIEGGEAVLLNNGLMVSTLTPEYLEYVDDLFRGLAEAANAQRLVLFTGEVAIHGDRLQGPTDFTVDWMADAVGLVLDERAITGEKIKEGDEVWGFAEPKSLRCNGISAARRAFKQAYGSCWHEVEYGETTLGELAIEPSTIFHGLMVALTGGYRRERKPAADIHGAAHASGGGAPEKVGRMLRATGRGVIIDDPFPLPPVIRHAQEVTEVRNPDGSYRPMTDEEMVTTWHGGTGYYVVLDSRDAAAVDEQARLAGIPAKRVGTVTKKPGVRIRSNGVLTPGKIMDFS